MFGKLSYKLLALIILVGILCFLIFKFYLNHKFYTDIFRLSSAQISNSLITTKPQCIRLRDCKLLPGDILIRRYITSRTWLFDQVIHPYFTHSAFYLGDDQLVEAIGTEKNSKDDIQIDTFSKSDWLNLDMNDFVIIRPKNYSLKLNTIKNNLINIANDPDYIFGLPEKGLKRTACADIIFEQLFNEKMVTVPQKLKIITPDYLFWLFITNQNDFEIVGYNISI